VVVVVMSIFGDSEDERLASGEDDFSTAAIVHED
jgi:hypothetical protein